MEAAEASSPSADGEILLSAFSLLTFFCACGVKRKWLTDLCNLTDCVPLAYTLRGERPMVARLCKLLSIVLRKPVSGRVYFNTQSTHTGLWSEANWA